MPKKNFRAVFFVLFLTFAVFVSVALFSKVQVLRQKAEELNPEIVLQTLPQQKIKRVWNNFAQGGEEKGTMLNPAKKEIKELQPQMIRIDHLYDSYEIIKRDSQGKLEFDFSLLDQKVAEIVNLGAIPFLSLSYFPSLISSEPTKFPASLSEWEILVRKTIQRYSGRNEKNIWGVYYEVWNEPDLFGSMNPTTYFFLYESTARASLQCGECNYFKIGGPAITTMKGPWMETFLSLVTKNQTRLDFISWHSYQKEPQKTQAETEILIQLANSKLGYRPELVISEWGSLPEISPLHDSYFDAAHVIEGVSILKQVEKLFSFELKDGPDPKGNKYWGRWGLLTHESFGLSAKPRYYPFLYLNKLLEYEIVPITTSPQISLIGSTDGKESYTVVVSRDSVQEAPTNINLRFNKFLPGQYTINIYSLLPTQNPLQSTVNQISFNGGDFSLQIPCFGKSVHLAELTRISPALIKVPGRTSETNDYSAKVTSSIPALIFFVNLRTSLETGNIEFWVKPTWGPSESGIYTLIEGMGPDGDGFSSVIEVSELAATLRFSLWEKGQKKEEIEKPLSWSAPEWHHFVFNFDNGKTNFGITVDNEKTERSFASNRSFRLENLLYVGSDSFDQNSLEGSIDNLVINFNGETFYKKDFD